MKKLFFLLLPTALLIGCNTTTKNQKTWIYETLPEYVWIDKTYDALEQDADQRTDKYIAWANQAIEEYNDKGESDDLNTLIAADLWGLSDLYLLGGGSSSAEKKRAAVINKYKKNSEAVLGALASELENSFTYRDSSYEITVSLTDEEIFHTLFGTPESIPEINYTGISNVAKWIAVNTFQGMERPVISSCEYDKEKDLWVVRMDNADTQYVKFYKRDDGEYDVEYGSKLKTDGTPDSEDTYTTNFKNGKKVQSASSTDSEESILKGVRAIYAAFANEDPNLTELDQKYSSTSLKKAIDDVIAYDKKNNDGYIGFFEFDYHVMGQDFYNISITELKVDSANAHTAKVSFNLHNLGEVIPMKLDMVKEDGEWKIDNYINAGEKYYDLRANINEYLNN